MKALRKFSERKFSERKFSERKFSVTRFLTENFLTGASLSGNSKLSLLESRIAKLEGELKDQPKLSAISGSSKRSKVTKHIFTSTQKLIPYEDFRKFAIEKNSKQIDEDTTFTELDNLALKPYDQSSFQILYDSNPIYHRTVNQIARDAAGLGWHLEPSEAVATGEGKENKDERKRLEDFLSYPNPHEPLRKILEALIIDWGVVGLHTLEVTRNKANKVASIFHVPAYTVWVSKGEKKSGSSDGHRVDARIKYCQRRDSNKVWFKRFGEERNFSARTGEEGDYSGSERANEMFFTSGYYPGNDYYSVPAILPAVGSTLGLIEIRDYNLSFFTNHGIPEYIVILTGDWEESSDRLIAEYLRSSVKGSAGAHKSMVIQLGEGCSMELQPLAVKEREGSFRVFNQIWREDVLASYSMPSYRVGILPVGSRLGGGKEAQELTAIYKMGVIEPLQRDLEDLFNLFIIREGLGYKSWTWKLNDMDIRDLDKEVERYNSLIAHGVMTPDEVIDILEFGTKYPGGNTHYISSNLKPIEIQKGRKK